MGSVNNTHMYSKDSQLKTAEFNNIHARKGSAAPPINNNWMNNRWFKRYDKEHLNLQYYFI